MKLKAIVTATAFSVLTLGLSGCSKEPSAGDIEDALQNGIDAQMETLKAMAGSSFSEKLVTTINDVEKLGCEAVKSGDAFNCDIKLTVTAPMVGKRTQNTTVRMIEGDDGWEVMGGI